MSGRDHLEQMWAHLSERARTLLAESSLPSDERERVLSQILEDIRAYEHELVSQNGELMATRDKLRAANARYERLFERAPAAHLSATKDLVVTKANRAALRLFDSAQDGVVGKRLDELIDARGEDVLASTRRTIATLRFPTPVRVLVDVQSFDEPSHHVVLIPLDKDGARKHASTEDLLARRTMELHAANERLQDEVRRRDAVERRIRTSQSRLRALAERLSKVEEDQRRKLASELHDLIGQTLISANMKLGVLERDIEAPEQQRELRAVRDSVRQMVEVARGIIAELRPPVLDEHDFETAVVWLGHIMEERYSQRVETVVEGKPSIMSADLREFLFRAARELLRNAAEHSESSHAEVLVSVTDAIARLVVRDPGVGFDVASLDGHDGFGLFEIRERVEALGGTLSIESEADSGTDVSISIPLEADET
jgi:signal transduction histidine kinase